MQQRTIESVQLVREIGDRGFAEFEHKISTDMVEGLIDEYARFTLEHPDPDPSTMDAMLPDGDDAADLSHRLDELDRSADTQDGWHKYRTNTENVGKPNGYTSRSFQERALKQARGMVIPPEDPKEFYHFTPAHYADMARNHTQFNWGAIPPEVGSLNTAFAGIHTKASELIVRVCSIIEETHPEIRKLVTERALRASPVRLLFYHPTTNEEFGAAHYDKGMMTLQIAESHRGLRVASSSDDLLEPVIRDADHAAFFPGTALNSTYPGTPFQPGWHDIIQTGEHNDGRFVPPSAVEACARWALIFFANYENYVNPDKATTHAR